jgi:hypothetical protein
MVRRGSRVQISKVAPQYIMENPLARHSYLQKQKEKLGSKLLIWGGAGGSALFLGTEGSIMPLTLLGMCGTVITLSGGLNYSDIAGEQRNIQEQLKEDLKYAISSQELDS